MNRTNLIEVDFDSENDEIGDPQYQIRTLNLIGSVLNNVPIPELERLACRGLGWSEPPWHKISVAV